MATIRYFPRMFLFYFSAFHIYFFSFPFGFSYVALLTIVLFLAHSMIHFWNKFEVPALESGIITAVTPRVGLRSTQQTYSRTVSSTVATGTSTASSGSSDSSANSRGRSLSNSVTHVVSSALSSTLDEHINRRRSSSTGTATIPHPASVPVRLTPPRRPIAPLQSWQLRTLEDNMNRSSTTISSGNGSTINSNELSSHVELSRRIQHQQMTHAFSYLGYQYRQNNNIMTNSSINNRNPIRSSHTNSSSTTATSDSSSSSSSNGGVVSSLVLHAVTSIASIFTAPTTAVANSVIDTSSSSISASGLDGGYVIGNIDIEEDIYNDNDTRFAPTNDGLPFSDIDITSTRAFTATATTASPDGGVRIQSRNNFGYRNDSYHVFGNNFEED